MDAYQSIKRMEKAIEAEPDKIRRWAMRKVIQNTITKIQLAEENR